MLGVRQRHWLRAYPGRISSEKSLMALAERSGFAYAREAGLRPFFWPPVPRASFIAGTVPPGWRYENGLLYPPSGEGQDAGGVSDNART